MPDYLDDHEDDTDLVRQLRKQLRDKTKSTTDAEARAAAAEGKLTERHLSEILTAKGVNPKAAKFLVSEGVDASDESAVAAWLDENSDLFPASTTAAKAPTQETQQVDDETVDGYQQLSGMSAMQRPANMDKFTEINRTLSDNATADEVFAAFSKGGL